MRRGLAAVLVCAGALAPALVRAQEEPGRVMMRVRPVYLIPANGSSAIPSLGVPKDAIHVSSKVIPDIDFTYFYNQYFSTELVLSIPQEHDVTLAGAKIGTFSHLPPTLLVQAGYPIRFVRPYVGAGINLTLITAQDIRVPGVSKLTLSDVSVGPAGQVGVDFQLSNNWSLNVDAKYVVIGVDVKLPGGTKVTDVTVNPWLLGGGLAYRF